MSSNRYTPKAGSKAAIALALVEAQGTVTLIDLCQAAGIERKNVQGTLQAALSHGVVVKTELDGMVALRWVGQNETRAEQLQRELQVSKAIPARRSRTMASTPPLLTAAELGEGRRSRNKSAVHSPAKPSFRCGLMSDGTLRLEGSSTDLLISFLEDSDTTVIDVSFAALETLSNYLTLAQEARA